jgi:thymidine kinase
MFSGKTGLLIERLASAGQLGLEAVALKPVRDTRDAAYLVSHTGRTYPAQPWGGGALDLGAVQLVAVDEAQFLPGAAVAALEALGDEGRTVVVAGLDLDFRREAFGPMPALAEAADLVHRLTATCSRCLRPAEFTQRLVDGRPAPLDDETVLVGAEDLYQPRCGECYEAERADPSAVGPTVAEPWRSRPPR